MNNLFDRISFIVLFTTLSIICPLNLFSQFKPLSGIHNLKYQHLDSQLEKLGFGKVTYYYDETLKKEGNWNLYPKLLVADSLYVVNVSTINGLDNKDNFIIFYNSELKLVQDTIGPFYDSFVDAIDVKLRKGIVTHMTVRLTNPPEESEPRFTIIKYVRKDRKLVKVGSTFWSDKIFKLIFT